MLAPLTVVLESDADFRKSEGLALIDDVSRLLSHQRQLTEVRSATQPLGSPEPLSRARLASRLGEVNAGFHQLAEGAGQLSRGLTEGAAKLRAAIWLEETTGLPLTSARPAEGLLPKADHSVGRARVPSGGEVLATGLKQASTVLQWSQGVPASWNLSALQEAFEALGQGSTSSAKGGPAGSMPTGGAAARGEGRPAPPGPARPQRSDQTGAPPGLPQPLRGESPAPRPVRADGAEKAKVGSPSEVLLRELTRAAAGAAQIADGAARAHREVTTILNDPVGRHSLDRLLIDEQTVREHPELRRSFAAYITPDGRRARIDVTQADRIFSNDAMNQVLTLRRRLHDFLGEYE
ncbi:MAG TPA: hypothetical protein VKW77_06165, partial [Acidimicrobiales bacterium]|nr:hypothetical protein [Acidimicrobiales bacterium]